MGLECVLQRFYRSTRFRLASSLRRYGETGQIETVTVSPVSAFCGRGLSLAHYNKEDALNCSLGYYEIITNTIAYTLSLHDALPICLASSLWRYFETGKIETVTVSPVSASCERGLNQQI